MLIHYLRIAARNISRYPSAAAIKLGSLWLGLVASAFILLYLNVENSYDKFHGESQNIYRLMVDQRSPTTHHPLALSAGPMAPALYDEYEEVQGFVRVAKAGQQVLVGNGDRRHYETSLIYADSNLFALFDFPLLQGSPEKCLEKSQSVVLTERLVKKYFGGSDPLNQSLEIDSRLFEVTGVMADVPENSHLQFDLVIPIDNFSNAIQSNWFWFPLYSYLLINPETDPAKLQAKLPGFLSKYLPEVSDNSSVELSIQQLDEIYLADARLGEPGPHGSRSTLQILSLIALAILIISALNFINISTAQSVKQIKEVGVRKLSGASLTQLLLRFSCESVIISAIAFTLAMVCLQALLPWFADLVGKNTVFQWSEQWYFALWLMISSVVLGILAGLYPAMVISKYKPTNALKGSVALSSRSGLTLKNTLVVFQFVISIILVIGVLSIRSQLNFLRSHELGFNKEHTVTVNFGNDTTVVQKRQALKSELFNIPAVQGVSFSSHQPGSMGHGLFTSVELPDGQEQQGEIALYLVDFDFLDNYGLEVVAGRKFNPSFSQDSTAALMINEGALKSFGFTTPQEAIGQEFTQWGRQGKIIGVVKDFNYQSLHGSIEPLSFQVWPQRFETISIKVSGQSMSSTIESLKEAWASILPDRPFNYQFLDLVFNQQYQKDERFGKIFSSFTLVALLISSLGLLGLSLFNLSNRVKEVAIRKVHGAEIPGIIRWLTFSFIKQVLVAFIIAAPIGYLLVDYWLQQYAYQVGISAGNFLIALVVATSIALVTVVFQVAKAAVANPIQYLKHQ